MLKQQHQIHVQYQYSYPKNRALFGRRHLNGPFYGDLTEITFDCIHQLNAQHVQCRLYQLTD